MATDPTFDAKDVKVTTLLKSLNNEQTKSFTINEAGLARAKFIMEAPISAKEGTPCLCTEYIYMAPDNNQVKAMQERIYKWKAAWDGEFTFDPTADYDSDASGSLP